MNDPPGMRTTLRAFNRDVLKITDIGNTTSETYDWQNIPAMVNTVTMTKLSWLSSGGLQAFIRNLEDRGYTSNTVEPLTAAPEDGKPLILGFMKSLDHDNQWCEDPKLLFVRDPCVYRRLFLKQIGEDEPGCLPGCDTPPGGKVWSWGANDFSQLGGGRGEDRYSPAPVAGITDVQDAAAGSGHVLALDKNGYVWTWGAKARSPEKIPGLNLLR